MASRRSCTQTQASEWESHDEYYDSLYDTQYPDENVSGGGGNLDHSRLYITNIPKGLNDEGLRAAFGKFGTLTELFLSNDHRKKYALIRYETAGEAKLAMMKMNKTEPLKLNISIAYKSKRDDSRPRKEWQDTNENRDRQSTKYDAGSVSSKSRITRAPEPISMNTNGENNDDDILEDDYGFADMLDPNLTLELENLKMEQLKVREEQLQCKHRMIMLKHQERPLHLSTMSNRCILPDGKILVRNMGDRSTDLDLSQGAGAGDSNETTVCCSCKSKPKSSWDRHAGGSSTPSTCVLCSEDRSDTRKRDKSVNSKVKDRKSDYSSKIAYNKNAETTTPSRTTRRSDYSKIASTVSKKSYATSRKDMKRCGKCRSEVTCDLKYSDFYTDSDNEDETNRLIQLRSADYMDIVEEDLKLVIALAGYPKSKIRLRLMAQFQRSLAEVIDMQLKAGLLKRVPSFLDYYLNRGALVCICKDQETRDWMVRISPGLQERMDHNVVLLKAKVKRLCLAVLKIPRVCWPATAQDAFKLLQYFNPTLKTGLWKIYGQKLVNDVEYTSFLIDRVSGEVIRGSTFKNVIDYSQMEFELTGYTEIYYECLLSGMEEDLRSVASRSKLLDGLRSESTPRNNSDPSVKAIDEKKDTQDHESIKDDFNDEKEEEIVKEETYNQGDVKLEFENSLQKDVLKKLKDVKYISDKDEVLVWSDETNYGTEVDTEKNDTEQDLEHNIATSGQAMSDKTESFIESNDNLISRSSNLNIDSNRGIAYHRRTNYLHVEPQLKVAITLEGYPHNKLQGTHIRRLKHLFKEYLHKDLKMQRFANLIIPKFQDIYLSNGAVIYICDSLETKDYLTEVLPKFIISTGLKLTFRDIKTLVRYTRIVMRLPKEHAHVESLDILLKLQTKFPGLKPDCWKYYSDVAGKQKRQFGVDPESLEVIKSVDFDPTYEGDKIIFRIIDRQKRDLSYEEVRLNIEDMDSKKQRDVIVKNMYAPIDPEIMAAPLNRIRTNHYSDLIADDLKLYVGPCKYPESRVDEMLFHMIKRTLENIVLESLEKYELNEETMPKFHDMYLFDGVIFIICANMLSRNWIENALTTVNSLLHIQLKSTEFRGAVGIISMFVKTDKETDEVIALLQEQNPRLRTKYWRKISTVRTKTKLDVVLQIDKLSAQVITSQNFNKYIGSSAVEFKLGHLQSLLKPKSSLEELTKMHTKPVAEKTSGIVLDRKSKSCIQPADIKVESLKEYSGTKPGKWSVIAKDNVTVENETEKKSEVFEQNKDQQVVVYPENKNEDVVPAIVELDSPKSAECVMLNQQGYHKIVLKIPMNILPENKEDLNIIFDLLEDKNPGLNIELWQIFTETVYPSNGKFTVYIDKQSVSVLQGKNFDPTIGGEKLQFYF